VAVNFEHLFDGLGDDQSTDDALVADKNDAVLELQSGRGRSPFDGFACVLDLEESSVWAESGDSVIVSSSAWLHGLTSVLGSVDTLRG